VGQRQTRYLHLGQAVTVEVRYIVLGGADGGVTKEAGAGGIGKVRHVNLVFFELASLIGITDYENPGVRLTCRIRCGLQDLKVEPEMSVIGTGGQQRVHSKAS
jgi:hypothetical protein